MKEFLMTLFISIVAYFSIDYIFDGALLYLMGGIIGGSINEIFKLLGVELSSLWIIFIWIVLLVSVVFLVSRLPNVLSKYFAIIVIALLLYVVDLAIADIPLSDSMETSVLNIFMGISIVVKSILLTLIIHFAKGFKGLKLLNSAPSSNE